MFIAYNNQRVDKPIGSCRQLFIDDDVIAAVKNVTRRQHTPRKHPANPLVERDTPWEHTPFFRTSAFNVIRDPADGVFKCWYEDMYEMFGGGFQFEDAAGGGEGAPQPHLLRPIGRWHYLGKAKTGPLPDRRSRHQYRDLGSGYAHRIAHGAAGRVRC